MRNSNKASLVQSVERALSILEALAGADAELGVTQLGKRLGVHKTTALRLVSTLAEHGLVERDPETGKYRLGFGLVRLAAAVTGGLELVQQARPILRRLAEETRETVNLAVLDGKWAVNIDQVNASPSIVSVDWVGRRTPLHCTSNGKVLLADLPEAEKGRLMRNLERLTPNTIVAPEALRRQLEESLSAGYAFTVEELEVGLNAVAAPVRGARGDVVAAISVSGPAYRLTPALIPRIGRMVAAAARQASRRMGHIERRESVG